MSINNIANTSFPNTLNGLESVNATNITINGVDISTIYVPFINSPQDVDLSNKNLTTTGRIQTNLLKIPSLTNSTSKYLQLNSNKEVISTDLGLVYVPYTGGTYRVYSSSAPLVANELVNKQYVDGNFPNYAYLTLNYLTIATAQSDYVPYNYATSNITLGSYTVYTNKVPTAGGEVVNKTYVDTTFPTFGYISSTYAPLASPALTGTPTAPTAGSGTNTTQIATTEFVQTALNLKANLASPTFTGTVTLPSVSFTSTPASGTGTPLAINGSGNLITATTTGTVGSSVVLSTSPALTGTPTAPTAGSGTNTTQIATTEFVQTALNLKANIASPTFTGTVTLPSVSFTSTPASGTGTLLAINGSGNLITTTSSINQTSTSTSGTYYIPFVSSSSTGAFVPLVYSTIMCNPNTGLITASRLTASVQMTTYDMSVSNLTETFSMKINNVNAGTNSKILAINSGNYVIEAATTGTAGSSVVLSSSPTFTGTVTLPSTVVISPPATGTGTLLYLVLDTSNNLKTTSVSGGGDAYLANTQTFTGINTFSNQMTLTKGFDLTLGSINSFVVRNSSSVTQFTVTNTGVTMGNLVLTGNTLNMSSTAGINTIYSGDSLGISASATTSKNIYMTVAGTALQLDQYGLALSSSAKTLYCNNYEGLSALGFNMLGGNDSSFKINNTLNSSSQPVGFDFQTMYGSYPSYTTNARISGLGIGANTHYSFASNPLTLNGTNNTVNIQSNGTTRFAITSEGTWMPASGSKSFYITDTAPDVVTDNYNRFFATGGTVYNDFYNIFQWRVYPNKSPLSGLADIMKLKSTGLTISKSSNSHATLANYELVLGDNSSGTNTSAKMLIRGNSTNAALCPSIDFTSYNTHTTVQGSLALYDDTNYGGIFAFIVKPYGAGAGGSAQSVMEVRATNTNVGRITFPTTYYVDLFVTSAQIGGLANPGTDVPLKITASYNVTGPYWFYGGGYGGFGVTTFTTGSPQPMSILAYGTVSSNWGFSIASDIRIKKDIQPAEHGALQVIDKIPIKSYDLIDNYRDGLKTSYNIIAQELLQVYPEAVSKGVSFIPNIYIKCQWIIVSETEIEIYIEKPHKLVAGDEIEIILEDNSIKECDVTAIIDEKTFRVTKWDDFKLEITDECFIYGKKVKDFLRIDKTKVAMLGLAGTKELHQIVKLQQAKIEEQSVAINTLTDSVKTLTEHLTKLTNMFNELSKK
ncbi:hypothetical protein EB001_14410 [bacterium]|nr:hypothetical protein [bacterium]